MVYLIALLIGGSVAGITIVLAGAMPARSAAVSRRLQELEHIGANPFGVSQQARRIARRQRWSDLVQQLGDRVQARRNEDPAEVRLDLVQAGYRSPGAVSIFTGLRLALPIGFGFLGLVLSPAFGRVGLLLAIGMAMFGYILPSFYVRRRIGARQKELIKALPDGLDAMVVCVEAGLGLNQAIVRVADEIRHISVLLADELALVNLEIRAGTPRDEALRHLADRTGVEDIRSLVTMLIQTERFGTSIAQALRVQSDTLRTKRRQRAEETAAKMAVKMLFPLVFFIFPALFVVVLGPTVISLIHTFSKDMFS